MEMTYGKAIDKAKKLGYESLFHAYETSQKTTEREFLVKHRLGSIAGGRFWRAMRRAYC